MTLNVEKHSPEAEAIVKRVGKKLDTDKVAGLLALAEELAVEDKITPTWVERVLASGEKVEHAQEAIIHTAAGGSAESKLKVALLAGEVGKATKKK